jgi:ATP-dependent Zn protease
MSHDHKVEELTEIFRMIESAAKNGILVLATTNRREALDPALLRKGRFDHSVLVDYPTEEEVELALEGILKDRLTTLWISPKQRSSSVPHERCCLGRKRSGSADGSGKA